MDDLISRQAAIGRIEKKLEEVYGYTKTEYSEGYVNACHAAEKMLNSLPSAQPKRGKWIDRGERGDWEWQADGRGKHWHEWECNTCHHYFDERTFFCPHCGCDMRGEQYG